MRCTKCNFNIMAGDGYVSLQKVYWNMNALPRGPTSAYSTFHVSCFDHDFFKANEKTMTREILNSIRCFHCSKVWTELEGSFIQVKKEVQPMKVYFYFSCVECFSYFSGMKLEEVVKIYEKRRNPLVRVDQIKPKIYGRWDWDD